MTGACDAAYPPGDVDAWMTRLGVVPIGRYLTVPGDGRGVTKSEIERHLNAGHPVIVFDEVGNGARWKGGYPAGLQDGQAARSNAGSVNWHDVIYNAYDTDIPNVSLPLAAQYQSGHNDGLGHGWMPFGAYAGNNALKYFYDLGLITYGVSANAGSWHHGVPRPAWCQWQQGYMNPPPIPSTDPGVVFGPDYGQYPSPTQHVPQEDDMPAFSQWPAEDQWALANSVANLIISGGDADVAQGPYEGKRPPANLTTEAIVRNQAAETQVLAAILTKLEIPFTWDQGAIKIT